jgi:alpha-tubulin suppressor-like RCC1 family protein
VTSVTGGEAQACALTTDGAVFCWGANWQGRLGDGTYTDRRVATPATGMTTGVAKVVTGKGHTCALKTNGQVWCWGRNWSGQLGDGTTTEHNTGAQITWPIQPAPAITDVVCGEEFTCVVTGTGGAFCFGENGYGQLGDDTTTDRATPTPVTGMAAQVADVEAGAQHTCLIKDDHGLWCWGSNYYGRVGDGSSTERHLPVAVTNLDAEVTTAAGGRRSTCAIKAGLLYCWGYNYYGQVGDGTTSDRYVATAVTYPGP